jgi:hypothetical protein
VRPSRRPFRATPDRGLDDRIEHHQPSDRVVQGERSPKLDFGLADGAVERMLIDVIDARAASRSSSLLVTLDGSATAARGPWFPSPYFSSTNS